MRNFVRKCKLHPWMTRHRSELRAGSWETSFAKGGAHKRIRINEGLMCTYDCTEPEVRPHVRGLAGGVISHKQTFLTCATAGSETFCPFKQNHWHNFVFSRV